MKAEIQMCGVDHADRIHALERKPERQGDVLGRANM